MNESGYLLENTALMMGLMAALVRRLGGTVTIPEKEFNIAGQLHAAVEPTLQTVTLRTISTAESPQGHVPGDA